MAPLKFKSAADAGCEVNEEGLEGCGPDRIGDTYKNVDLMWLVVE
jgi:hypothetical protein